MSVYTQHLQKSKTPQTQPLPGTNQVQNSAGGYVFEIDPFIQLDRFLILGAEGGTYYASERKITLENATCIAKCADLDEKRTIDRIIEVSDKGLAPKNDPAIFALALLAGRKSALQALTKVCRTATHLFQFVDAVHKMKQRGWGRSLRTNVSAWYTNKTIDQIAYQVIKYRNREGWTHRDILRLCHASSIDTNINDLFRWCVNKPTENKHKLITAFETIQSTTDIKEVIRLIKDEKLPWEAVPNTWFNEKSVWEALVENMPLTALIRNLPKLTSVGVIAPLSNRAFEISQKIDNDENLKSARIHPLKVLLALKGYQSGTNRNLSWTPATEIINALDSAYYKSFQYVKPTNKRYFLGLDVSGSMRTGSLAGSNITPRDASGALAMITVNTEPRCYTMGFSNTFMDLKLVKNQRLEEVIKSISNLPFSGTDCALPMIYATQQNLNVDVFVIYTDNETWAGNIHPTEALKQYRKKSGINAKLIVVGMTATKFSIADPNDAGMMDVVGFSADLPQVMSSFVNNF